MGKSGPNVTFNLFFPGLGWPWVGEFVGFIIVRKYFPTQHNKVNREHPNKVQLVAATLYYRDAERLNHSFYPLGAQEGTRRKF